MKGCDVCVCVVLCCVVLCCVVLCCVVFVFVCECCVVLYLGVRMNLSLVLCRMLKEKSRTTIITKSKQNLANEMEINR